jgi:hypothetical protein
MMAMLIHYIKTQILDSLGLILNFTIAKRDQKERCAWTLLTEKIGKTFK